ncbi:unknown [Clostridium sp. CAG:288]|nr:unknown [Clostridium sp. CAG:288]
MKKDLCGFYAYPKSLKKGLLFENIIIILVLLISVSISPFLKQTYQKDMMELVIILYIARI